MIMINLICGSILRTPFVDFASAPDIMKVENSKFIMERKS